MKEITSAWPGNPVKQWMRVDWGGIANGCCVREGVVGVMFSILLASIILYKAVIDRQRRLDESQTLPYQETDKQAEDWMSQYQKDPVAEEQVTVPTAPLQEVPKATYEAMFRHQHGSSEAPQPQLDSGLISAARIVIDKRTEEAKKIKADAMLADLQSTEASAPLSANETLVASTLSSVPLPTNEDVHPPAVDDLEF